MGLFFIVKNCLQKTKIIKDIFHEFRYKKCNQKLMENYNMLKKISYPSCNICDSVVFILRGARKRRNMAQISAKRINADAGIKTGLRAL